MFGKKARIYLRLSSLAAALAKEPTEEAELTLVCERGVGVSGDGCFQPIETVRERLFVEMRRHANAKA